MIRRTLPVWLLLAALALTPGAGRGQILIKRDEPPLPIDAAAGRQVIDAALKELDDKYVFPEVAAKMARAIRRRQADKEYDAVKTGQELAELLTKHLQEVSRDKHLRVMCSTEKLPPPPKKGDPAPSGQVGRQVMMQKRNAGYVKVERLPGNVGYLRLDGFADPSGAAEPAAAAMNFLANTDALVIDLRHNGGGSPRGVQLLCSYLFDQTPVHLNSLHWREGDRVEEFWTLKEVAGKRYLGKPVYVLAGPRTFSGAEEFCYNLQTRKRATIVGETTGGGANPGGFAPLGEHFGMFVPTGRAVNPVTKTNWEGTGVKPDVAVPADQALEKAHELAFGKVLEGTKDEAVRRLLRADYERGKGEGKPAARK
jgi:hypothetical protein